MSAHFSLPLPSSSRRADSFPSPFLPPSPPCSSSFLPRLTVTGSVLPTEPTIIEGAAEDEKIAVLDKELKEVVVEEEKKASDVEA